MVKDVDLGDHARVDNFCNAINRFMLWMLC
jgi:hypothetical protein